MISVNSAQSGSLKNFTSQPVTSVWNIQIQENMSGKSNKERGTKMSPVFNETDSKINLCWLLALTFVPHTLKTKSLKLKLFVNCFFQVFVDCFWASSPLATSHPWAKECPQVATFQPAARYPTPFCAPLPGFSLIFVLPHFISAFSKLPSLCPTGKRILTHCVGGSVEICWKEQWWLILISFQ